MGDTKLYRIWRLRFEAGYTQEEVAKYLHMSRVMYCNLENGRTTLHVHHVVMLAHLYNVTSDYILCLSDNMRPAGKLTRAYTPDNVNSN